jgi:hypothetical protein
LARVNLTIFAGGITILACWIIGFMNLGKAFFVGLLVGLVVDDMSR